eukprot:SAG25_NODE_521_length_7225_cov_3.656890_3_plen_162_part_00
MSSLATAHVERFVLHLGIRYPLPNLQRIAGIFHHVPVRGPVPHLELARFQRHLHALARRATRDLHFAEPEQHFGESHPRAEVLREIDLHHGLACHAAVVRDIELDREGVVGGDRASCARASRHPVCGELDVRVAEIGVTLSTRSTTVTGSGAMAVAGEGVS